ncbi:MAG: hypothetical protein ACTSYI_10480 [Promethearchaeota archaeon]
MTASPPPLEISSLPSHVSLQCRVLNPVQNMFCYFSLDTGTSWFSLEMASTTDNEYRCDVPLENEISQVLFFLKIITLDGQSIIDNNKGVLFQFRVDKEKPGDKGDQIDQENFLEFKAIDEKGSFSEKKLAPNPLSSSHENLTHISSNNPFSGKNQASLPQFGKKIIKFNKPSDPSVDNPSEIKQAPRSVSVSSSTHSCSKCQGRFPKFLKICPYCGREYS